MPASYFDFELSFDAGSYGILHRKEAVTTPGGERLSSYSGALMSDILEQFSSYPYWRLNGNAIAGPYPVGSYALLSTEIDFLRHDLLVENRKWAGSALDDPVLRPGPGPEVTRQTYAWRHIGELLLDCGVSYPHVRSLSVAEENRVVDLVSVTLQSLSLSQLAVARTLAVVFGSRLAALCLASGRMSPDQFALAMLATTPLICDLSVQLEDEGTLARRYIATFAELRDAARSARSYIGLRADLAGAFEHALQRGEQDDVEFKMTALGHPHTKPRDQRKARDKILKTVAAFLNSNGGVLLIGVSDGGEVHGMPELEATSIDTVALQVSDLLASALGLDVARRIRLSAFPDKKALMLSCEPHGQEVSVTLSEGVVTPIRQGPRTIARKEL